MLKLYIMTMRFFLNSFYYLTFGLIFFLLWALGFYWLFFVCLVVFAGVLFFSRRLAPEFQEDAALKEGIFYAPVNGKVVSISEGVTHPHFGSHLNEVVVLSPWWREHGIYFPAKAEVIDLFYERTKGRFRYFYKSLFGKDVQRKPSLSLGLRCVEGSQVGLDFYKCVAGMWPQVRVIPGDKGRAQVNMGFFGLGGLTVLYLPQNYEILLKEGLDLIAGQSIVANLKENKRIE